MKGEGEEFFSFLVRRERTKKGGKVRRGEEEWMVYFCLGNVIVREEWWDRR